MSHVPEPAPTIDSSHGRGAANPVSANSRGDGAVQASPQIGFELSGVSGFTTETARLLRRRLTAYTAISLVLVVLGLLSTIHGGLSMTPMRVSVLAVLLTAFLLLRSGRKLSIRPLRWIELTCFLAIIVQISILSWIRIESSAAAGDVGESLIASQFSLTLFCLAILTYGLFIPNTWRRACIVLLPVSLVPLALRLVLQSFNPDVAAISQSVQWNKPIPETLVAAGIAIYGSHVIHGVRQEAFQAKQLGQYVLKELLGTGGMGAVYLAEHRMLKRPCAIKLVQAGSGVSESVIERFEQEVQSTALLSHWNSIEVYDYGRTEDGTFFYVMELLPGADLQKIVQRFGTLPPSRCVHFLMQMCDALQEAHGRGLVHRDIKPGNIFAAERGGVFDVGKLLDFGLVRQTASGSGSGNGFAGTPAYMSPEQALSYDGVDCRVDIYSLGAVGFFLLTGRPPFVDDSISKVLLQHRTAPVPAMKDWNDDVPSDLEAVLRRCLEKKPESRYSDVTQLRDALANCADAGRWTPEDARQWWLQHNPQSLTFDSEITRGESQKQQPTIAKTMDLPAPDADLTATRP
ncbi:serine/threonine protein kinase [Roseiconus nitratireducens]|uniref:Serine/threonine protein kinase n=1 Tax=Roseiconus nitratireducens TaxID=2605748 RepID=A0A5M6D890_9BACT|nr:serine/threonine-protein kinase [Roseiconus nitratireducens]KAA5543764.1 serine/threonine protein kinase [Roseiconus nitratireducens]